MRRFAVALSVVAIAAGGTSCRSVPEPIPPVVPTPAPYYSLCVEASPRLNWYDQSAHTLYLRLFPLSSLEGFLQAEVEGLLDSRVTMPGLEGTPVERTVYPGSKITIDLPLRPDADFLGVVAGYYRLEGSAKSHRAVRQAGMLTSTSQCMRLGPNAIEVP